ncbi:hypothetical protein [Lelliottia wanjuensis]|uniref:hypothetical protein n=1 Tax=Lelliottia wanjuensis TaxID=3050585 RepID=UPI00254B26EC|nr:hypothetical protein [Lelliottia sp. V104_15]MDK9606687.1 hypothetical protein [Lelliottia sp. V104_15]
MGVLQTQKSKKPALKAGFSNLAPLTGIAITNNWMFKKLKRKIEFIKTTRMTPFLALALFCQYLSQMQRIRVSHMQYLP